MFPPKKTLPLAKECLLRLLKIELAFGYSSSGFGKHFCRLASPAEGVCAAEEIEQQRNREFHRFAIRTIAFLFLPASIAINLSTLVELRGGARHHY